jgi:formate dehydrogenase
MGRTPASPSPVVLASVQDMRQRLRSASHTKGRQPDSAAMADVVALLGPPPPDAAAHSQYLIEHLHRLNDHYGVLREPHLVALAHWMRLPMVQVYEVASFYHHFSIAKADAPAPRLVVRVCSSLSCSMAGSDTLLAQVQSALAATGHNDVQVQPAPCVGRCEQAPVAVLHQCPVPYATASEVLETIKLKPNRAYALENQAQCAINFEPSAWAEKPLPVVQQGAYTDLPTYMAHGGYSLAAAVVQGEVDAEDVMAALEASGLRGLGGAGFPAGRKWRAVSAQPAPRYMVVNIDEGEPGTFKDRTYLERDPHRFLEGMLIAAQVVGTQAIYIYLRDEYHACRALLQAEITRLQAQPPCPLPHIELRRGAGAYICGEESALIESLEGKRGEPRMRPPYIAQAGLWGRPTLAHNFETLYWVRDIIERGARWWTGFGRRGRTGLRSFSVSGRVQQPGVKLAPAGISVQELIDEYCGGMQPGHQLYAYLPGGASGGILPASLAHVPLDFDTLQDYGCFIGSAAVIVLSQHDTARNAALNVMRFLAHESCGQCTPCRVGTDKAVQLMQAPVWDAATLGDLADVMADASICGLGQAAANPVRCIQRYFAHEVV